MAEKQQKLKISDRVAIISATDTYLRFFVLVVLILEFVLGVLALKTQGQIQLLALSGMLFVITLLIVLVSFFAYRRPEALLRSLVGQVSPEVRQLQDFCKRPFNPVYRSRLKAPKIVSTYNKVDTYDGEQESIIASTGGGASKQWPLPL